MKLRRLHNPRGWTSIPNSAVEDRDLSWRARGLLAYLLSRPDGWTTDAERLAVLAGQPGEARSKRAEGRDAVLTALRELEDARYLHRVKRQLPAGSPGGLGGTWLTDYYVFDVPTEDVLTAIAGQVPLDLPSVERPVDNLGRKTRPGPEKPNSVEPASLTSTTNHKNSSSQRNPPSEIPQPVDNNEELAALAATVAAPLADVARLEPDVRLFALRAHLAAGSASPPPSIADLASLVLDAHYISPASVAGRLSNADVIAWLDIVTATESAASSGGLQTSGSAAAPPGGLPAAHAGSAGEPRKSKGAKIARAH